MFNERNNEDDDEPLQLVGHDGDVYYNSSGSDSSDDDSDDQDKDGDLYDGPDPGVSGKMLATRRQMIKDRQ